MLTRRVDARSDLLRTAQGAGNPRGHGVTGMASEPDFASYRIILRTKTSWHGSLDPAATKKNERKEVVCLHQSKRDPWYYYGVFKAGTDLLPQ